MWVSPRGKYSASQLKEMKSLKVSAGMSSEHFCLFVQEALMECPMWQVMCE